MPCPYAFQEPIVIPGPAALSRGRESLLHISGPRASPPEAIWRVSLPPLPLSICAQYLRHVNASSPIPDNIRRFRDDIESECARLGRSASDITVVAVSKTMTVEAIRTAHECGLVHFGENRVQEAKEKIPQADITPAHTWHLIGHLQSNKAKDAVDLFDLIQSVDSWHLADELNRRALAAGKRQDVLIQVNTSGEEQKSGCDPWEVDELVGDVVLLENLRILGLMTIGPLTDDEEDIAPAFHELHSIFKRLNSADLKGGEMRYCSMGMSDDWKIALGEGSNMLRIGRAIFVERR